VPDKQLRSFAEILVFYHVGKPRLQGVLHVRCKHRMLLDDIGFLHWILLQINQHIPMFIPFRHGAEEVVEVALLEGPLE